ncbi:MAG TPA: PEP-CTERM sorting domain-containing protein [Pyrinomonadaceae bacterium]|nr:PEP-CTERM sorting domain-containing protein [Pyrinomonadaceae bacterium]
MRIRVFRAVAAILSIALLAGSPVQAAPVAISEVLQVLSNQQGPAELRLRGATQDPASGTKGSVQSSVISSETSSSTSGATTSSSRSLLSGIAPGTNDPVVGTVTVIAEGDVDGTVCDCGEIPVVGSIPKWPFLFLAAIPLFFIPECKDCDKPPVCKDCIIPSCIECPVPTPTPTPPGEVPEPTALLLFGSGLAAFGAGLRRRYLRGKLAAQLAAREEN